MSPINKREILRMLQELVMTMFEKHKEFTSENALFKNWMAKKTKLDHQMERLNSCDALWVSAQYEKWYQNNPKIKEILEEIKKRKDLKRMLE